jgi:hypothetical protein
MGDNMFYILDPKRLEPAEQATRWLGRIVQPYNAPGSAFTPPNPFPHTSGSIKVSRIADVEQAVQASQNRNLRALLSRIASLTLQSDKQTHLDFETSSLVSVRLENYGKVFDKLKIMDEVKADLDSMLSITGPPAYMIVALLIWTDAKFEESLDLESKMKGQGKLPVGSAATAAGTGLPVPVGDLEGQVEAGGALHLVGKGFSPKSHIFAFEYKCVRKKWSSLVGSFKPELTGKGPRVRGDKVFAGDSSTDGNEEPQPVPDSTFTLDEDDVLWTDLLTTVKPEEEEIGNIIFTFNEATSERC